MADEVLYKAIVPGYTFGQVSRAPISEKDLQLMLDSVLWTKEDEDNRKVLGDIFKKHMKEILDAIVNYVGSREYLLYYFKDKSGTTTITEYVSNSVGRIAQWILDCCYRPLDQKFIDYQYEIGLRHTPLKKGKADNVQTVDLVHARYMVTFIFPFTAALKPFIQKEVEDFVLADKLYHTWFKLVTVCASIYIYPFVKEGWW